MNQKRYSILKTNDIYVFPTSVDGMMCNGSSLKAIQEYMYEQGRVNEVSGMAYGVGILDISGGELIDGWKQKVDMFLRFAQHSNKIFHIDKELLQYGADIRIDNEKFKETDRWSKLI